MQSKEANRYLKVGDWWYMPEMDNFVKLDPSGKIVTSANFDNLCQKTINYFVKNPGRLIRREELLMQVWGRIDVSDSSLTRVIRVLRQTIGDNKGEPIYLQTISKAGYRFIATVTEEYLPSPEKPLVQSISQPHTATVYLPQKPRLRRYQVIWLVLLLLLLMGLVLSATWYWVTPALKDHTIGHFFARYQRITELPGLEFDPTLSPDGLSLAYIYVDKSGLRNNLMLKNMANAETKVLLSLPNSLASPQWSPDGSSLLYQVDTSHTDADIRRVTLNAQQDFVSDDLLFSLRNGPISGCMSLSPDGQILVYQAKTPDQLQTSLWFYYFKTDEHEQITVLPAMGLADFGAVFSQNGEQLAFIRQYQQKKSELWLMDVRTRSSRLLHAVQGEAPHRISWSKDDQALLLSRSDRQLLRLEVSTGELSSQLHTDQKALAIHATAQGQIMAVIGDFWQYSVARHQNPLLFPRKTTANSEGTEIYPSSRSIFAVQPNPQPNGPAALYSERSGQRQIWWYYPDGKQIQISDFSLEHQVQRMTFSPNGRQLAVAYGDEIWLFSAEHRPTRVSNLGQSSQQPSWSADGQHLYFVSDYKGRNELTKMHIQTMSQSRDPQLDFMQQSPDGQYQVVRQHNAEPFRLRFVRTGEEFELPFAFNQHEYPVMVLGKNHLYFAEQKDKYQAFIKVFDLETQQVTETGLWMAADAKHFSLSADEEWLYLPKSVVGETDIAELLLASSSNAQLSVE
jgi:DNA-binding winged helix-turn-helix (wHTH) protein